jgi:Transglycosylase-like domain
LLRMPIVVGAIVVATAMTITLAASPADKRTPVVRVRVLRSTHLGRTAQQWYAIARHRLAERDWLQKRLGVRVRQLIALSQRFKAEPNRPPHYYQWLCIHAGEGAWNDPNAPYYGGLQFSSSTWARNGGHQYAPEADQATPLEQMWVAEAAWRESGGSFAQWPNTARTCGLL